MSERSTDETLASHQARPAFRALAELDGLARRARRHERPRPLSRVHQGARRPGTGRRALPRLREGGRRPRGRRRARGRSRDARLRGRGAHGGAGRASPRSKSSFRRRCCRRTPTTSATCSSRFAPGTGGDESALFAGDLLRMYVRYAERHRWQAEIVSASQSELGGYKEVIVRIVGPGRVLEAQVRVGRPSRAARARKPRRRGASTRRRARSP